jgi:hypothetical protein
MTPLELPEVTQQFGAPRTNATGDIIYNCKIFIIQATGVVCSDKV